MKKILALVACLSLVASLAIGGSIAYLTDRDSEANVFTIGNVEIDLTESFGQGATLVPGVEIEKKPVITNTGDNAAWVWMEFAIPSALDNYVQGTESGSDKNVIHWNPLGATTEGYVNDTRVNNAIAAGHLPAGTTAADIEAKNMTWNVFNSLGEGENVYTKEINGVDYNVYVLLYNKALEKGETTLPNITKVYLDAQVDIDTNGDWHKVNAGNVTDIDWNTGDDGNPVIYVSAYGIQTDGFADVKAAYAAYGAQWGDKGSEYADPTIPTNLVDTAEELEAAIAAGESVMLNGDIEMDKPIAITGDVFIDLNGYDLDASNGDARPFTLNEGASLTIDAQNSEIKFSDSTGINMTDADLTINGGTFVGGHNFITANGDDDTTITLNDVNFKSTGNGFIVYPNTDGEIIVNVNGGEYESAAGFVASSGTITGTKITATSSANMMPAVYSIGDVTIENCDISSSCHAVAVSGGKTITVNNSNVTAPAGKLAFQVMSSGGTINVNNTTFTGGYGTTGKMSSGCVAIINIDGVEKFRKQ